MNIQIAKKTANQTSVKLKSGYSTTMFEINDDGREYEFKAKSEYDILFTDFITSLGFEAQLVKESYRSRIIIGGVEFHINSDNASYMSKGAWTRTVSIRKQENRFMALTDGGYKSGSIIRVHFNKELNSDKLRIKIKNAIQAHHDKIKTWDNIKKQNHDNTVFIAKFYSQKDDSLMKIVTEIKIHQGTINFYMRNIGAITINLQNEFIRFDMYSFQSENIKETSARLSDLRSAKDKVLKVIGILSHTDKLPQELKQWAVEAHEQRYNYKKSKYGY